MLVVFLPVFVTDRKIIIDYKFKALLKDLSLMYITMF